MQSNSTPKTRRLYSVQCAAVLQKSLILILAFLIGSNIVSAQMIGDYRTQTSGKWSSLSVWQVFDGQNWVRPTQYPGQSANVKKLTISEGHIVNLTVDLVTYRIDSVIISGRLLTLTGSAPKHFNFRNMVITPSPSVANPLRRGGSIGWASGTAGLRIPYNANIAYPRTYKGLDDFATELSTCAPGVILYLGGGLFGLPEVRYASCSGPADGLCLTFEDVNEVGGILRTSTIIPIPPMAGAGAQSCVLEFETTITVLGVPKDAEVSTAVFGRNGNDSVYSIPDTIKGVKDGSDLDLDGKVDGQVTFAVMVKASDYGKYPISINVNKGYDPNSPAECRDFGLVTTDTIDFLFIDPPTLDINAPTSVCSGQNQGVELTNPSSQNYIGVFWSLDDVEQTPVIVNPNSTEVLPIPGGGAGSVKVTINELSYAAPSPVFPCSNELNQDYIIDIGTPTDLAIDLDQNTQPISGGVDIAAQAGCRLIASLVSGSINSVQAKAFVSAGNTEISGRPVVGRRAWLRVNGGNSGNGDRVTLYATQNEFLNFNAVTPDDLFLPVEPNDPQNYRTNLRIYRFDEGEYDSATGLPTVPFDQATVINSNLIELKWNITHMYWEMNFPSNQLGLFVIGNINNLLLPLNLLDFTAVLKGKRDVALNWQTADERNVQGFEVQVSADGTIFNKVGFVNARNASTVQNYEFETMMPGKLGYFRLKMIDNDGKFEYSPVRLLQLDEVIVKAYPNPAVDQVQLDLTGYPAGTARITDMSGRAVMNFRTTSGMNRINTKALSSGVYVLEVMVGLEKETI